MTEVLNLRVVRPYATKEEFLDAEAWTLNLRSVLLIGVSPHPEGVNVRVELTLSSGKALVVAEGNVVKHLPETSTRPAGLVVRFRRMSGTTNDFLKRAVAHSSVERPPVSSPLASISSVIQPLPSQPSSGAEAEAEAPRATITPTTKPESTPSPTRRPTGVGNSSLPPQDSTGRSRNSGRPSAPPDGTHAQRASVIPAARRASTHPPTSVNVAPTVTVRTTVEGNRTAAPKVNTADSHRDTDAMDRLRRRGAHRPITVPPDREAILARLKKP